MNTTNGSEIGLIQERIASILNDQLHWTAPLLFKCQIRVNDDPLCPHSYHELDLNKYVGNFLYRKCRAYFDPVAYPPPAAESSKKLSTHDQAFFERLRADLQKAAFENGQEVICNGSNNGKNAGNIVFNCKRNRVYKSSNEGSSDPGEKLFRKQSLINDKAKNARGPEGIRLPRRTGTDKPTETEFICHYRFTVKWDLSGYYILLGWGQAHHEHHAKLSAADLSFPSRLVESHDQEIFSAIKDSRVNDGAGRHFFKQWTGYNISRSKFRYISRRNERSLGSTSVADVTSVESFITTLTNSDKFSWAILYDEIVDVLPKENTSVITEQVTERDNMQATEEETTGETEQEVLIQETNVERGFADILQENLEEVPDFADILNPDRTYVYANKTTRDRLRKEMRGHAAEKRASLPGLSPSQKMVLAIAWGVNDAIRLFKLHPEVICCDVTEDTNNEKRPLLTFSVKESHNNQVVFLNVLLPDEKACSFRWVFQAVLPTLLGRDNLKRVNVIITDGDSQETSQIDDMRENIEELHHNVDLRYTLAHVLDDEARRFRSILRVRCGWHIVEKGFSRHCPTMNSVPTHNQESFLKLGSCVKNFVYSWMKPNYCETEEEVRVSKALLQAMLSSKHVKDIFACTSPDDCPSLKIKTWIRQYVEPLERNFLYCHRKSVRHFDAHKNTSHEGTNNSAKSNGIPVLACHSIAQAAQTLNAQALEKCAEIKQLAATSVTSTKLWSKLPLKNDVTKICVGLVEAEWKRSSNYLIFRADPVTWRVVVKDGCWHEEVDGDYHIFIPIFRRVRSVSLSNDTFMCTCCSFERVGYPCCHSLAVLRKEFPDYQGPSKNDVALFWHSAYALYGERPDEFPELDALFTKLRQIDVKGPALPCPIPDFSSDGPVIIPDEFSDKPTIDRLVNPCYNDPQHPFYISKDEIRQWLRTQSGSFGLSQNYSQVPTNEDSDDDDGDSNFAALANHGDEGDTYYNEVNPSFKALCRVFEHDFTSADAERFKAFADKEINDKHQQRMLSNGAPSFDGSNYVSSAAATRPNAFKRRKLGKRSGGRAGR